MSALRAGAGDSRSLPFTLGCWVFLGLLGWGGPYPTVIRATARARTC